MWPKSGEPRFVLPPKHAMIYSIALRHLSDLIGWEDWENEGWESGIAVFDRLTPGQKQVALLEAARALLHASAKAPKVSAYLAASVAAVYETLRDLIHMDIESDNRRTKLRGQMLAALNEMDYWSIVNESLLPEEEPTKRPPKQCADREVWTGFVEVLRTEVLDDYDFDMESSFADVDPETGAALKQGLNIDSDYFTDVPEDPAHDRLREVQRELHELTAASGQVE